MIKILLIIASFLYFPANGVSVFGQNQVLTTLQIKHFLVSVEHDHK